MAEQDHPLDDTSQVNARPEVDSAASMSNAAEHVNTSEHARTQHSQETANKRRKLDFGTPANNQDELEGAKQALLRRLFGKESIAQPNAEDVAAPTINEPGQALAQATSPSSTIYMGHSKNDLPQNTQGPHSIDKQVAHTTASTVTEELEANHELSPSVERLETLGQDNGNQNTQFVEGTTAKMAAAEYVEAKEAPSSSTEPLGASDPDNSTQNQTGNGRLTLGPPRLEEAAPGYSVRFKRCFLGCLSQNQATWSPDGKCVITTASDRCLRTHVLFNQRNEPPSSVCAGVYEAPHHIRAFTPAPIFDAEDPATMRVLASVQDNPLRLFNVNDPAAKPVQSYELMSEGDDVRHIPIHCLDFTPDGQRFVCGGDNSVAIFDISRYKPIVHLHTHNKKGVRNRNNPYALGGSILTFSCRHDGVLAVGTTSRKIGFYERYGESDALMVADLRAMSGPGGSSGVEVVRWSPDGNHLYISEKNTNVISILDIRFPTGKLGILAGDPGKTTQRLTFDLMQHANGYNVIAGGTDGMVRIWENPFSRSEDSIKPDLEWKAHNDVVANAVVNPVYPSHIVTTAGSRPLPTEEDYDSSDEDKSKNKKSEGAGAEKLGPGVKRCGENVCPPQGWMKIWSFT